MQVPLSLADTHRATDLSHPVDVYAAWIDACEDEAESARKGTVREVPAIVPRPAIAPFRDDDSPARKARTVGGDDDEGGYEADGFVVDDEEEGGKDYDEDLDDDD